MTTRILGGNAPSGPWTRETLESLLAIESDLDTPLTREQVLRSDEWSLNALETDRAAVAEAVEDAEAGEPVWSTKDQDGYYYCVGAETSDEAAAAAIFAKRHED